MKRKKTVILGSGNKSRLEDSVDPSEENWSILDRKNLKSAESKNSADPYFFVSYFFMSRGELEKQNGKWALKLFRWLADDKNGFDIKCKKKKTKLNFK